MQPEARDVDLPIDREPTELSKLSYRMLDSPLDPVGHAVVAPSSVDSLEPRDDHLGAVDGASGRYAVR